MTNALTSLVFALAVTGIAAAQTTLTPADLISRGSTYDGQRVTVSGTASHILHKTSRRGNAYTTYDLCSGTSCIRVFEFGSPSVGNGSTVTVSGTFAVSKHVGDAVYHNELDVDN